jgi:dTDP-4-dehydrorhamnose reductase
VNAGAHTAVDLAETERELAMKINAEAPAVMAEEAKRLNIGLVHYSTDYVFDGSKTQPYTEHDATGPLNVYGETKLAGEQAIQEIAPFHLIFRTSWVYGARGKNFLLTMRRLARERKELKIVDDQYGAPTWCRTIADITSNILIQSQCASETAAWWSEHSGIYHLTAKGQTTWYQFAKAILEKYSLDSRPALIPIATNEYPTPARRPVNSVLSCDRLENSFCKLPHWSDALRLCQEM